MGGDSVKLSDFREGIDYDYSPGGVTAMLRPIVKRLIDLQIIDTPTWISLGPGSPERIDSDIARLYNVWLEASQLSLYANFKEGIWNEMHGLGKLQFKADEYEAYVEYNWLCTKIMLELLKNVDFYWIHDFQQLHVGNLIGPSAPAILRWHIPFNLERVSDRLRTLILKSIEGFDSIVVSTKRDLEGLIRAGYRGIAYAFYPYLDEKIWSRASDNSIDEVRSKFKLTSDDRVLLVVARMDPIKGQDVAIRALSTLSKKYPDAKLVLAGNGSFTGSARGGLGHPKTANWRSGLEDLTHELMLDDRVLFTGHVTHEELNSLYTLSEVVVVPSKIEGFNLTAVEGWLHGKPCVVSQGAGVSELVHNEVNGYTFVPSEYHELADKLDDLLGAPEKGVKLGENGTRMSKQCSVDTAVRSFQEVFERTSAAYSHFHPTSTSMVESEIGT
jgi:glycosyltransferase involved in cell wall biosynthesis